jgi:hypothetical protein
MISMGPGSNLPGSKRLAAWAFGGEVGARTFSCMHWQGPSGVSEDSTEAL